MSQERVTGSIWMWGGSLSNARFDFHEGVLIHVYEPSFPTDTPDPHEEPQIRENATYHLADPDDISGPLKEFYFKDGVAIIGHPALSPHSPPEEPQQPHRVDGSEDYAVLLTRIPQTHSTQTLIFTDGVLTDCDPSAGPYGTAPDPYTP